MNRLQRWLMRLLFWCVPGLRRILDAAGGRIERLAETVQMYRAVAEDRQRDRDTRITEYAEALAMLGAGPWGGNPNAAASREAKSPTDMPGQVALKERMWDLELALEDQGWKRETSQSALEFSRWGVQQIMAICRLYRIKNPLIQRGILVSSYYVFGRGFEVSSPDEATNEVVKAFFDDPRNQKEIGLKALTEKEATLYTDGNIFWALFTGVNGEVLIRSIDAMEIMEIISDPDDSSVTRYYHRGWVQMGFNEKTGTQTQEFKEAWYVDEGYEPETKLDQINGKPVMRDPSGDYVRIIHQKDGGLPKWHFGCSRVYAAIDWARAYKQRLEDYASITRALARFAWDVKTKGGAPAIAALKGTFATTLVNDGSMIEQNPPPVTGSSFISGPATTMTPVKTAGVAPSPEEGRRLAHMVYMVFGLGEHFFADISTGNLATATSLDRPTELKFKHDQEIWKEVISRIARFVVMRDSKAPSGKLREAAKSEDFNPEISVDFPPIIEGDIPQLSKAIVDATWNARTSDLIGMDEKAAVLLLLRLHDVPNPDDLIELMYPAADYEVNRDSQRFEKQQQQKEMLQAKAAPAQPGATPPKSGAVKESFDRLALAIEKAKGKWNL